MFQPNVSCVSAKRILRFSQTHLAFSVKYIMVDPISQLVGYIMSGDPTYITGHKGARSLITKFERDEILEVVFRKYLENK